MDVFNAILIRHVNIFPTRFHFRHVGLTDFFGDDGEIQAQILYIPVIIFQIKKVKIQQSETDFFNEKPLCSLLFSVLKNELDQTKVYICIRKK